MKVACRISVNIAVYHYNFVNTHNMLHHRLVITKIAAPGLQKPPLKANFYQN